MTTKTEEVRTVTKPILIKLNDDDFLQLGKTAAAKRAEQRKIEDEFDESKKSYKGKIDTLDRELNRILRAIAAGEEEREVSCQEVQRFEQNIVETWYNGEKIEERAMEPHERQTAMFDEKQAGDDESVEDEKQPELPLKVVVDKELDAEDEKPTTEVPPIREQVLDEFKGAQKVVRGW